MVNIAEKIRDFRQQRGLSQGDIEERTGLLRCYLSRVENGHTTPSLQTLAKLARAMDVPLSQFFVEGRQPRALSEAEQAFLGQLRQYAAVLSEQDRRQVLSMVRGLAGSR